MSASTGAALLRAIVEAPDDTALRLIYADWLEEEDTSDVACPDCSGKGYTDEGMVDHGGVPFAMFGQCQPCRGTGRVSTDRTERAEFIHVQCELAAHPKGADPQTSDNRVWFLRRRERELLATPAGTRFRPDCCYGFYCQITFRRGFVEAVTCSCQDWRDHGPAIVACQPVTDVQLSDRSPWHGRWTDASTIPLADRSGEFWMWLKPQENIWSADMVPWELYDLLPNSVSPKHPQYYTEADARAALASAAVAWARDQARLPPLLPATKGQ